MIGPRWRGNVWKNWVFGLSWAGGLGLRFCFGMGWFSGFMGLRWILLMRCRIRMIMRRCGG
jgi:hypothetical protein